MHEAGWFREENPLWPGQALALRVERVLFDGATAAGQRALVFANAAFGNVLVLDGVVQATERDEFAYQEMISHVPLAAHGAPRRVLIVGGGDGGCLREVLRHPGVEAVDLVEIDATVIELSRRFLPAMAAALDDPKLTLHIGDGLAFLGDHRREYDVIISDTSDPEGPAEVLFEEGYFRLLHAALRPGGVVAMQASESVWLQLAKLGELQRTLRRVFPVARYAAAHVPTYTSGQLGLMVCAADPATDVARARAAPPPGLRYYTPAVHAAAFVLPTFAREHIDEA